MDPTPTIWDAITTVITNLITLFGTVANALMTNELFQITLGIVIFIVLMGIVYSLVKKIRKRGK